MRGLAWVGPPVDQWCWGEGGSVDVGVGVRGLGGDGIGQIGQRGRQAIGVGRGGSGWGCRWESHSWWVR